MEEKEMKALLRELEETNCKPINNFQIYEMFKLIIRILLILTKKVYGIGAWRGNRTRTKPHG